MVDAIKRIIPQEVDYLNNYQDFKHFIDRSFEMPNDLVALLVRFLKQNNGKLSKRAKSKEFVASTEEEVENIEQQYHLILG